MTTNALPHTHVVPGTAPRTHGVQESEGEQKTMEEIEEKEQHLTPATEGGACNRVGFCG